MLAARNINIARRMSNLASASALKEALNKGPYLIDLRTPPEIAEVPGPDSSLVWDYRNYPALPADLPTDKDTPVILF